MSRLPAAGAAARPPVPVSCAGRPLAGGLVAPFVNVTLADGGTDFRATRYKRFEACWQRHLCQVHGAPAGNPAVLFGGPRQFRTRLFTEPPVCVPCALYVTQACPMVAGRMTAYPDRPRVSQGRRGDACADPACGCAGWVNADPATAGHGGDPAHPWYAAWIRPGSYTITAHKTVITCTDRGCKHNVIRVNGGRLDEPPLKVFLVSQPGQGRVWERLAGAEVAELMPS